jgi:hypothetical protein
MYTKKMSAETTVRNLTPLFLWLFMMVWLSLLTTFTYVYFRDAGLPGVTEPWGMLLLLYFWLLGLGATRWAFKQACTKVSFVNGRLLVDQRYPFYSTQHYLTIKNVELSEVITDEDSEGKPYYKLKLKFGTEKITIAEGHSLEWVEEQRDKLLKALEDS